MSPKTYFSRHTQNLFDFSNSIFKATVLLIFILHPAVILGQDPPPNIQNTSKASDLNLRSNLKVNPSTHALEFEITLANYPGRGGLGVPVKLSYSSKVWRVAYQSYTASMQGSAGQTLEGFTSVNAWFNGGWTSSVGIPVILHDDDASRYSQFGQPLPETTDCDTTPCYRIDRMFIRMPDNSVHELRSSDEPYNVSNFSNLPIPTPDDLYAVDGSRLRYQRSTQTLFFPDGSRFIFSTTTPRLIDRNGNTLTYTAAFPFNFQHNFEIGVTDTLNRSIPAFRKTFANNTDVVYSLPGLNNVPINYTFKWKRLGAPGVLTTPQSLHYIAEFGCPPAAGQEPPASGVPHLFSSDFSNRTYICNGIELFDPVVLHQILLPTGQAYTFTYNVYGEIEKVVLPSGGYERYEYESLMPLSVTAPLYSQANRGVKKRHVSKTGNLADEVTWNYAFTGTFPYGSGNPGTYILSTTAPDQSRIDRYLHTDSLLGTFGFNIDQGKAGMVYDERQYSAPDGSGVRQLLQRKLTDWVTTGSNASNQNAQTARRNARVAKEVAIFLDTGTSSALTRTTVNNYDLTYQFNIGAMQSSVAQYDWVLVSQSTAQTSPISSFTTPSQPLRRSETTNLLLDTNITQATRDAYRARHLVALVSSTRVKNGAGTIVAQTSMQYDQYALTTVGSVTGWIDPQSTYRGNLTINGRWLNTTGNYLQTHNTYDQFGNVRTATDAKGNQTQIGYSTNHAYPTTTTTAIPDPSGQHGSTVAFTTTTAYDVTTGLVLSTTDPNNATTSMAYDDPLNRLTQVTRPNGGHVNYDYFDAPGDLYVKVLTDLDSSRAVETRTYFDGIGRVVRNFLYDGTPSTPWTVTDTYYDIMGRVSKVSNPYRVSSPSGIVPASCSVCTTKSYDALGRVISVTSSDNAQTTTSYAGSTSSILGTTVFTTDPAGKARKSVTDALGRLVAVYEAPASLNYETTNTYDLLDNLTGVTQHTQTRSFEYDSLSRLRAATNPESGRTDYQYDNNDNMTQRIDSRGITTTYTYDALNRNKTVDYSDTAISPDVSRIYDGAGNGKGRLWRNYAGGTETTGTNVEKTLIHSYDALGSPLILRQSFKVNGSWFVPDYEISRTYNLAGGVATQNYPSGRSVTYNYDAAGRLGDKDGQNFAFTGNLGGNPRTYSRGILYAASGQLRQEQFGTNTPVYHKRHYNVRNQPCDVRASAVNDEWGGELGALLNYYSTAWAHCGSGADNNGNVLMSQTIINSVYFEDRYTYDALNRLTAVSEFQNGSTPLGSQQYDYDRWGNRTIIPSSVPLGFNTTFEKQDATNRLYAPGDLALPMGSRRIQYDAAGNQTRDTYTGYGNAFFDAENHITSIQDSLGGTSTYNYNADGLRTRRKINNQETWQIYGMDGELLAEYPASGATANPKKEYGYRNGELLVTTTGATDTVWSDDGVPAGAATAGDGEGWNWVSSNPAPFSGSTAHQSNIVAGLHQHYFYGATATLSVSTGDTLVAYVYLDPSNMPSQIMLQWAEGGSWEHRAYWGANNLPWGVDGTNSRRYMGPLPAAGSWVRLEVPASLVGLEGYTLHGMAFSMWGGRATWDKAGKTNIPPGAMDTVWSEDAVPAGAAIAGDGESWNWVSSNPAPFSGSTAHQSNIVAGLHQHYFYGATATLSVSAGDKLVAYVYLDPSNMPSQIMLQWAEGGSWEHRAYWGANNLPWGVDGTNSRRYMGPLPAAGSWVRLEVPASLVGLEGYTLHGMAFSMWGGRATWDKAGKTNSSAAAPSVQWLVSDHLGTPRMIIDQTGSLANMKRHDYLPFGEELLVGRTGMGYGGGDGVRQKFTSKERDVETGLDFFGARYFASTQGRFTSADPLMASAKTGDPQTWNRYTYVLNNPLRYVDPDGLEGQDAWSQLTKEEQEIIAAKIHRQELPAGGTQTRLERPQDAFNRIFTGATAEETTALVVGVKNFIDAAGGHSNSEVWQQIGVIDGARVTANNSAAIAFRVDDSKKFNAALERNGFEVDAFYEKAKWFTSEGTHRHSARQTTETSQQPGLHFVQDHHHERNRYDSHFDARSSSFRTVGSAYWNRQQEQVEAGKSHYKPYSSVELRQKLREQGVVPRNEP